MYSVDESSIEIGGLNGKLMSEFNGTYVLDENSNGLLWYRDSESGGERLILQYYDQSWNFYSRDNEVNEEGNIYETGELAHVSWNIFIYKISEVG